MARSIAGSFTKRVSDQIWAVKYKDPSPFLRLVSRYSSSYDKNVEEETEEPAVVPDRMSESAPENKYWGPHPRTGVFGPAGSSAREPAGPIGDDGPGPTVLDQTAWFRPQEDVEKPPPV